MKKRESENSYRSILKGTTLFGGVQIFNIIIQLVRGKFVAVILGPEGMGISSLFNSSYNTLQRFACLGLPQAIVRETAAADDQSKKEAVISTVSRLVLATAILGAILCVVLSIPLSRITFGSIDYAWQFVVLGVAVAFGIAGNGKLAILQGLHQVKRISKASLIGGLAGLFVGVPLYYLFGDKGIVPAIVAVFLSLYIFYTISLNKCYAVKTTRLPRQEFWAIAKRLIPLGIVLMAGDIIGTLMIYLINLFLRYFGSVDEVGLYQAANSVTNQYSGVVFAAMAMDYFPRLSKVAADNSKMRDIVNRQTEIVALIIAPAMCLLILSAPPLIEILLSEKFLPITQLMRWFGLGILIKALSYPMAYITFAKGNKKVFFILEGIVANLIFLILSCGFFYWFGLIGLGYSIVIENGLMLLIYFIVNHSLYEYTYSQSAFYYSLVALIIGTLTFCSSWFDSVPLAYSLMAVFSALALGWCFFSLKKKLRLS